MAKPVSQSPKQLAWSHFNRYMLIGQALVLLWVWSTALLGKLPGVDNSRSLLANSVLASIASVIYLGFPAALIGRLVMPLMDHLFARVRAQYGSWPSSKLACLTAVIFLVPALIVTALTALFFPSTPEQELTEKVSFLVLLLSLPWVLGALLATLSLRHQLELTTNDLLAETID